MQPRGWGRLTPNRGERVRRNLVVVEGRTSSLRAAEVKPAARGGKADSGGQSGVAHRSERRVTAPPGFSSRTCSTNDRTSAADRERFHYKQ